MTIRGCLRVHIFNVKVICKQSKPTEELSCDENPCHWMSHTDHVSAKSVNPSITEQGNVIMA